MFFIIGWNHSSSTNYGNVEQQLCPHCDTKDFWRLERVSTYFTLFFIPIFPHETDYLYRCSTCDYGIGLTKSQFNDYKSIADINTASSKQLITDAEKAEKLEKVYQGINERKKNEMNRDLEESKKWTDVLREKSDDDLALILKEKRNDYTQSFLIAAERELGKRTLNTRS